MVSQAQIESAWQAYADGAAQIGEALNFTMDYGKARSGQVDARGMLKYSSLIIEMRKLGTGGRFKPTSLEKALVAVMKKNPGMNSTKLDDEAIAKPVCAKLSVMLAHSRYMLGRRESLLRQVPDDDVLKFECFCDDLETVAQHALADAMNTDPEKKNRKQKHVASWLRNLLANLWALWTLCSGFRKHRLCTRRLRRTLQKLVKSKPTQRHHRRLIPDEGH